MEWGANVTAYLDRLRIMDARGQFMWAHQFEFDILKLWIYCVLWLSNLLTKADGINYVSMYEHVGKLREQIV